MGYIMHDAIIVTDISDGDAEKIRSKIIEIIPEDFRDIVSPIIPSPYNGYHTFIIAPDGGKEGHSFSDEMNIVRSKIIEYLSKSNIPCNWVHIRYGESPCFIANSNDID